MHLTFREMQKYAQKEVLKYSGPFAVELGNEKMSLGQNFYVVLCCLNGNGYSTETNTYLKNCVPLIALTPSSFSVYCLELPSYSTCG